MTSTLTRYCLCGASATWTQPGVDPMNDWLLKGWLLAHSIEGHGPTDRATALRARRRAERDLALEQARELEAEA